MTSQIWFEKDIHILKFNYVTGDVMHCEFVILFVSKLTEWMTLYSESIKCTVYTCIVHVRQISDFETHHIWDTKRPTFFPRDKYKHNKCCMFANSQTVCECSCS